MTDQPAQKQTAPGAAQQRTHQRNRLRMSRLVGLGLAALAFAAILLLPTTLSVAQQNLLAIIAATVIGWVTQALPIPMVAILSLALSAVLEVAPVDEVFGAFSSPTLFLLLGCLIMTRAMIKHGFGQRVALGVLSAPGIASSTYTIVISFGALAALLSAVMDNGALTAMLFPIAVSLIRELDKHVRERCAQPPAEGPLRFGTALLLITAYASTVGALLTPFGDAANLVAWQFIRTRFHVDLPVQDWMSLSTPIVMLLLAVLTAAVLLINKPEVGRLPEAREVIAKRRRALGAMSRGEINTAVAFGLAVFLWVLPPLVAIVFGRDSSVHRALAERLHPAVVAVLAAAILFALPISRREGFTLRWRDAREVDWGPVLLMGSAIALGHLMGSTGLAEVLGNALAKHAGRAGVPEIYLLTASISLMISELTTNLVSVSVLLPILPSVVASGGGEPLTAALIASFAGIYGFMLPISTTANAIVYGSGQVPLSRMIKTGFVVDISGIIVTVFGMMAMLRLITLD